MPEFLCAWAAEGFWRVMDLFMFYYTALELGVYDFDYDVKLSGFRILKN